jgi:hypothetical protein
MRASGTGLLRIFCMFFCFLNLPLNEKFDERAESRFACDLFEVSEPAVDANSVIYSIMLEESGMTC